MFRCQKRKIKFVVKIVQLVINLDVGIIKAIIRDSLMITGDQNQAKEAER